MKLELKDLKHYLDTNVMVFDIVSKEFNLTPTFNLFEWLKLDSNNYDQILEDENLKLCLLPLSSLIEQLHDGSIPIVELAKIHLDWVEGSDYNLKCNYVFQRQIRVTSTWNNIGDKEPYFNDSLFIQTVNTHKNMAWINEYLYANHFWLGDQSLFDKGIIIDKRTVKS